MPERRRSARRAACSTFISFQEPDPGTRSRSCGGPSTQPGVTFPHAMRASPASATSACIRTNAPRDRAVLDPRLQMRRAQRLDRCRTASYACNEVPPYHRAISERNIKGVQHNQSPGRVDRTTLMRFVVFRARTTRAAGGVRSRPPPLVGSGCSVLRGLDRMVYEYSCGVRIIEDDRPTSTSIAVHGRSVLHVGRPKPDIVAVSRERSARQP